MPAGSARAVANATPLSARGREEPPSSDEESELTRRLLKSICRRRLCVVAAGPGGGGGGWNLRAGARMISMLSSESLLPFPSPNSRLGGRNTGLAGLKINDLRLAVLIVVATPGAPAEVASGGCRGEVELGGEGGGVATGPHRPRMASILSSEEMSLSLPSQPPKRVPCAVAFAGLCESSQLS